MELDEDDPPGLLPLLLCWLFLSTPYVGTGMPPSWVEGASGWTGEM